MKIIITTSGLGSRLGEFTRYTNKALCKIGDRYAIDYILDNYKNMEGAEFIITIGYKGDIVQQYISIAYSYLNVIFVEIDKYSGPGSSLLYSLSRTKEYVNEPFIFHCCDSIVKDLNINLNNDTLFLYDKPNCGSNYTTIDVIGEQIKKIKFKGSSEYDYIYIGVAYVHDYNRFYDLVFKLLILYPDNDTLSDVHVFDCIVNTENNINYIVIKDYHDIGNIDDYNHANSVYKKKYEWIPKVKESISFHENMVIKFFSETEQNKNICTRQKYIGDVTPKLLKQTANFHAIELIDAQPLSKINRYGLIKEVLIWGKENLWNHIYNDNNFKNVCYNFYYTKTKNRIADGFRDNKFKDYSIINGVNVGNIDHIIKNINFDALCNDKPSNFHGDFILENILLKGNCFILLDWRSDFGGELERGDMYYDIAKLRHNIQFDHHNIEEKMYFINKINIDECELDMKCNYFLMNQLSDLDEFVENNGLSLLKVKILNYLIWINMAPLHEYPLSNFLFNLGKYNLGLLYSE